MKGEGVSKQQRDEEKGYCFKKTALWSFGLGESEGYRDTEGTYTKK